MTCCEVTDAVLRGNVRMDVAEAKGCGRNANVNACGQILHGDWSIDVVVHCSIGVVKQRSVRICS